MSDKMTGKRISVRIDENLERRLKQRAAAIRVDESEIVREALTEYLSKHDSKQSAYAVFKKAGMLGIVKDAPRDLSTNRKHFEGFGQDQ